MSRHLTVSRVYGPLIFLVTPAMDSSEEDSSESDGQSLHTPQVNCWDQRLSTCINNYPVSLQREQEVHRSERGRMEAIERRRQEFLLEYEFSPSQEVSIIYTEECEKLRQCCANGSWSFCPKCSKLATEKLLPSFVTKEPNAVNRSCQRTKGSYLVPQPDDFPLILRNLSQQDIRILRPLDVHCGDYKRVVHGYRQRTGPFRVSWSSISVCEKIAGLEDPYRRSKLLCTNSCWLKRIYIYICFFF